MDTKWITNKTVVSVLACLACLLWGSAYPAIKAGYGMFNIAADDVAAQMLFAGYRFFLAGAGLLVYSLLCRKKIRLAHNSDYCRLLLMGFVMTTLQYAFFYTGMANTTAVKASIIVGSTTFFSVILAHFVYRSERLKINTALGCILGFGGVIIVNLAQAGQFNFSFSFSGEGCALVSAFMLAVGGIYGKMLSQTIDPVVMTGWQLALGGFILIIIGFAGGGTLSGFTMNSTALLIYMAFISSAAFAIMAALMKYNPVAQVTIFNFTIPVFGASLSALFIGENLFEWKNLAALALVSAGILIVTLQHKKLQPMADGSK